MTTSWRGWGWKLGLASWLAIGGAIASLPNCALAQITPDSTLPNNSIVTRGNTRIIEGGTKAGSNLFHSFEQFSIPTGSAAYFNNALDIQNIISRVTGKSISNIDGLIKANGTANLFLINPNGIIFGRNASLNIGGSFLASTANAIGFGVRGFFSATNPESPSSLLTVNPSALLFNQIRAASIQNNSVAPSGLNPSSEATTGLRVPNGKSLLLVGGDINMDGGGGLNAFGGRVELGGLAGTGTVRLNGDGNNLSLSFPDSVDRSDISLSNGAGVDVTTAGDGGSIAVNARNLKMTGESVLSAGLGRGRGSNNSKAGNIEINATGVINLNNSFVTNGPLEKTNGQGGDVNISASTLLVKDGAEVSVSTFSKGKGGNLRVDAQDVQLIGKSANGQYASGLFASTGKATIHPIGDAGNLTIKTNTLLVRDGAQVSASTFGVGKGGNLRVDAQDVQLIGTSANGQYPSGLGATAERNSTGDAGNLTIKTNTLLVRDGAQVSASTSGAGKGGNLRVDAQDVQLIGTSANGQASSGLGVTAARNSTGDAGNLTIKTNTLLVRDRAQVITAAFGAGNGGNLRVDAQDVQLIGTNSNGKATGLIAGTQGTGKAGNLTITTQQFLISNGALTTVESQGKGVAGNLDITASSVRLDKGNIRARTFSGNGGNLTLSIADLLLMRRGSVISATAGTAQQPGDGGNITINAPNGFIVAGARENNDITANAYSGSGGRVTINAAGIFGMVQRSRQDLERFDLDPGKLPTNDITAFSQQNPFLSGTIQINTLGVDPSRGLVNLPVVPVDVTGLIAQGCPANVGPRASKFVVTGRGGLPPNPSNPLSSDTVWTDLRPLTRHAGNRLGAQAATPPTNSTQGQLVEAQGWVTNDKGEVVLVAQAPTVTPDIPWLRPTTCHAP